jgi:SAM-dependent methyltransferase
MGFETSHTEVEGRFLDEALGEQAEVLEVGCGRRTRLAVRRDRIALLVGVDVDEAAGRANGALDRFVAADACGRLPFDDASFDLVYANFVVEHLSAPTDAFREWRRVLRGRGELILITSNRASPFVAAAGLLPHRLRVHLKRLGPGVVEHDVIPTAYRANTPGRLRSLLEEVGFAPVATEYVATVHRYAGDRARLSRLLRTLERPLPPALRSTIVARYRASAGAAGLRPRP